MVPTSGSPRAENAECASAIDQAQVARREGVFLDPVYTGKAWRGLVGESKAGRLDREGATVFLHTGGTPGLFAYRDALTAG